jgi:Ca-activated chloride channel family protein
MAILQRVLFALVFSFFAVAPVLAEDGSRVILVLDASGSMRAKINGKSKIDIAKQVVGDLVKTWKPEDELGLIAYGHREKGNCNDIEVLREPGKLDASDYMMAVNSLEPKGQTPMTAAVKMAAESLQFTEKKATVILVSDGIENCGLDPCAVAEDLAKMGIDLKVHTVGFGLDNKGAIAQLKCLAEKTGGTYTTANNAEELKNALAKTVAPPPPPAASAFNVRGHVKQTAALELSKPYDEAVWIFHKPPAADGTEGAYVATEFNADMKANLGPGDYVATVTAGRATVDVPFKVEANKVSRIEADLEAGVAKLSGMIDENTPLADKGAAWSLSTASGKYIDTVYGATSEFMLNAGDYVAEVALGDVKVKGSFSVKSGEVTTLVIPMGSARLSVSAEFSSGGQAMENGMSFEVYKKGETPEKLGDWINTQYNPESKFDLPAGEYVAVVKLGLAETRVPVKVEAGRNQAIKINANAGFIAVKADGATSYEVHEGKTGLDGTNKWLTTTYDPTLNIAANAGSYLVQAFKGDAKVGEKTVEVAAGQRVEIVLP